MGSGSLERRIRRRALTVVGGWLLVLAVLAPWAPRLSAVLQDHGLAAEGDYSSVQQLLADHHGFPADPVILLFESQPGVSSQALGDYIRRTAERLRAWEVTAVLLSPLEDPRMQNGTKAYALLSFDAPSHRWGPLIALLRQSLSEPPGITVSLTGKPVIQSEVNEASRRDFKAAELVGIPAAFAILLLAFGGVVCAVIPIITGLVGVSCAMGIMYVIGTQLMLSSFVLSVIPMVGLALSLDFALMLVSRYREELTSAEPRQALATTMQTAGRAVLYAAATVALGLASTLWIPLPLFRSVALASLVVLAFSVLLAWTLVPALMTLLAADIRGSAGSRRQAPDWRSWSAWLMKRPLLAAAGSAAILLLSCLPLLRMQLAIPDASSLPASSEVRQAYERFEARFGITGQTTVYAALVFDQDQSEDNRKAASASLAARWAADPLVAEAAVLPPVSTSVQYVQLTVRGEAGAAAVSDWLRREADVQPDAGRYLLGGEAKYHQEVQGHIYGNLGKVAISIAVSNFVILVLAFRSVVIALKTLLMNALSLGASFGLLTWMFSAGWLGVTPGPIAIMIPVFIFGLAFSISMDYAVFLVSRIYETYRITRDNDEAVIYGLARTGRIISCAAAMIIVVTLPFAWGEVAGVQQLGVGIAAAIFIDATLIRFLLMPALMKLLGDWNWWMPGKRG
ncbi:MMPL family transporter [Paenibacillus sp. 1P07SE]|uniref:MMPL family transporter n=1 Tax=Paenibacillus sp. 1P07SE TaxID=3132209 RepID=UPI0039A633C3